MHGCMGVVMNVSERAFHLQNNGFSIAECTFVPMFGNIYVAFGRQRIRHASYCACVNKRENKKAEDMMYKCYVCRADMKNNDAWKNVSDDTYDECVDAYNLIRCTGPDEEFDDEGNVNVCTACIAKVLS